MRPTKPGLAKFCTFPYHLYYYPSQTHGNSGSAGGAVLVARFRTSGTRDGLLRVRRRRVRARATTPMRLGRGMLLLSLQQNFVKHGRHLEAPVCNVVPRVEHVTYTGLALFARHEENPSGKSSFAPDLSMPSLKQVTYTSAHLFTMDHLVC